ASQVGIGTLADGFPDFLHFGSSFIFGKDLPAQKQGVDQTHKGDSQNKPCCYHLERCQVHLKKAKYLFHNRFYNLLSKMLITGANLLIAAISAHRKSHVYFSGAPEFFVYSVCLVCMIDPPR